MHSVGICVQIVKVKFCISKPYIKVVCASAVSLGRFAPLVLKRVGLGTYLRLCGSRQHQARSEQLKEDSKSAYIRRFLCGEVIPTTPLSLALCLSALPMREICLMIAPLDPGHEGEALLNRIRMQG
jgi:hypothetical protein